MLEEPIAEATAPETVNVVCSASDDVNVAFYQNAVPIIRDLAIENGLSDDISEISIHLSAEPAFMLPGVWRIERVASKATHHIRTVDLKLDPAFLTGINSADRGQMKIRVEAAGKPECHKLRHR